MMIQRNPLVLLLVASPLTLAGCADMEYGRRYAAVLERGNNREVVRTVWLQQCERSGPWIPSTHQYCIAVLAENVAGKRQKRMGGWTAWRSSETKGFPFHEDQLEARSDAERHHVWFVARAGYGTETRVVATLDLDTGQRTGPFDHPKPAWASPDTGEVLERLHNEPEATKKG
jgi:hypothetical protein